MYLGIVDGMYLYIKAQLFNLCSASTTVNTSGNFYKSTQRWDYSSWSGAPMDIQWIYLKKYIY